MLCQEQDGEVQEAKLPRISGLPQISLIVNRLLEKRPN